MKKIISLVAVFVAIVALFSQDTWADGNLETYNDYDFSYIFMNDKYTSYDEAAHANGKYLLWGETMGINML